MKYKVTSTHPLLKEDIVLQCNNPGKDHEFYYYSVESLYQNYYPEYSSYMITKWIQLGYIEGMQEPIWTDSDMIAFARKCDNDSYEPGVILLDEVLADYKKEKGVK